MSGNHGTLSARHLHIAGDSVMHRLGAAPKLVGLCAFVAVVACTPRTAVPVLCLAAVIVVSVIGVARVPPARIAARLSAIIPFVLFAVALPFIGTGERTDLLGVSMSVDGLWAAWGIVAKAVIGATAGIVVTATTPLPELFEGLAKLRVPAVVVAIVAVMVRYVDVVVAELARTRRAMVARGHDPRWLWQLRPIASSIGTLFVRSYERGERVHLAMAARGFDGTMPQLSRPTPTHPVPPWCAAVPALVTCGALVVWLVAA